MNNKTKEAINHIKNLDKDSNDFLILKQEIENKVKSKAYDLTKSHWIAQEHWWSNNQDNIYMLQRWRHEVLHKVFWNLLPHQCIQYLLKIHWKSLDWEIIHKLRDTIDWPPRDLYKRTAIKNVPRFKKWVEKWKRIEKI